MTAEARETRLGMQHQARVVWRSSRPFAVGAIVAAVVFASIAALVAYMQSVDPVPVPFIGIPLIGATWFSLLILPAIGGGGDDDVTALAAVPAGRSFRSGLHAVSAASDLASAVLVPALGTLGAFVASWSGWAAGSALGVLGLVLGQVSAGAAGLLSRRAGPALTLAVVCAGGALAVRYASVPGPGSWFTALAQDPAWYAAWAVAVAGAWLLARALTDTRPTAVLRARTMRVPTAPALALFATGLSGVARSLVARNSLLTAALAPLFAAAVGFRPGAFLPLVLTVSAAVIIGANGFSYDGGGMTWLLARVPIRQVLLVRLAVAFTAIAAVGGVGLAATALLGTPPSPSGAARVALLALAGAAAGLVPSLKRPSSVDLDMARAQPAPPVSAVGVMFRTLAVGAIVTVVPLPVASAVVLAYVLAAMVHALRLGRDPLGLAALT